MHLQVTFICAFTIFLVTGCGIHLHRPEDAQLARAASASFKDVKLMEAMKKEFDAAADILNSEIAAVRRLSNARRDSQILAILGGSDSKTSWGKVDVFIDERFKELFGSKASKGDWPGPRMWEITLSQYDSVRFYYLLYEQRRQKADPQLSLIGDRLSDEDRRRLIELEESLSDDDKKRLKTLQVLYGAYIDSLEKYEKQLQDIYTASAGNGEIGAVIAARSKQESILAESGKAIQEVNGIINSLKEKQQKKVAKENVLSIETKKIASLLKNVPPEVQELKESLKNTRDLKGIQKKIRILEELLSTITKLRPLSAEAKEGAIPPVADRNNIRFIQSLTAVQSGLEGAKYPKVSELILESEKYRIELDRLRGLVALEEERKILLDLKLAALSREIVALGRARQRAGTVQKKGALAVEPSNQAIASEVLIYIADSWSTGRTPAEEIDFLINGVDHRVALENSSSAFLQWSNLIGVPLSLIVIYHEMGIKSEDWAKLVNAIALSVIAGALF